MIKRNNNESVRPGYKVGRSWETRFTTKHQHGYALPSLAILLMIVGVMSTGAMNVSNKSEHLASNAIQRNRVFQAADAASYYAQEKIAEKLKKRVYADDFGMNGLFTFDNRPIEWWKTKATDGIHTVPESNVLGVVNPPKYSIEEIGNYISDGGTGVVSLDVGAAAYGRMTTGGREIILYNVQSHANGSFNEVKMVVETSIAFSY